MLLSSFLLAFVVPVQVSLAFQLPWNLPPNYKYKPEWDGLRVRWGLNIFSESNFQKLPRREFEAIDQRFELVRDECKELENARTNGRRSEAKFAGRHYWKHKDPSLVLIYDVNGYIAGIQAGIPKDVIENDADIRKTMKEQIEDEMLRMKREHLEEGEEHHRHRRQVNNISSLPSTVMPSTTSTPIPSVTQKMALPTTQTSTLTTQIVQSTISTTEMPSTHVPSGPLSTQYTGQPSTRDQATTIQHQGIRLLSTPTPGNFLTEVPGMTSSQAPGAQHTQESGAISTQSPKPVTTSPLTLSPVLTTRPSTHPPSASMTPLPSPRVSTMQQPSVSFSPSPSNVPLTGTAKRLQTTFHSENILPRTTEHPEHKEHDNLRIQKRPLHFPYVEVDGFVFFTVYFIKPERICNRKSARTVDEFEHSGTGSGLYIQNGTDVNSVFPIPRDEGKFREGHFWKAEKCFWTQGKIYSYNFHEDQNCHDQFPLLLNYNKGRLTGFELLWKLDFSSPYLEHPDKGLLKYMFEKVPKCYVGIGRLTKLQIYLTDHYLSHRC